MYLLKRKCSILFWNEMVLLWNKNPLVRYHRRFLIRSVCDIYHRRVFIRPVCDIDITDGSNKYPPVMSPCAIYINEGLEVHEASFLF
jgi:hypothetical protein